MESKLTLSFDKEVIEKAKTFAAANNISLSKLTEYLFRNITSGHYSKLEELPIADWVSQVAEGKAVYHKRSSSDTKNEFYNRKK